MVTQFFTQKSSLLIYFLSLPFTFVRKARNITSQRWVHWRWVAVLLRTDSSVTCIDILLNHKFDNVKVTFTLEINFLTRFVFVLSKQLVQFIWTQQHVLHQNNLVQRGKQKCKNSMANMPQPLCLLRHHFNSTMTKTVIWDSQSFGPVFLWSFDFIIVGHFFSLLKLSNFGLYRAFVLSGKSLSS